jgi:uncharacterized RDD family membrane protein YckC
MGERFAAFLCDVLIQTALVEASLALLDRSPSLRGLEDFFVPAIPIAYMTLTEFFFHGTAGKRLLGIQVRADSPELAYPSFLQLLLRESVGKFVASLILGIGFLAGFRNPKRKTWADAIAGTVVVRTRETGLLGVLALPIVICACLALSFAWKEASAGYQRLLTREMIETENSIDGLHEKIFQSFFSPQRWRAGEPDQEKSYQQQMSALPPMLDEYNRLLDVEQGQLRQLRGVIRARKSYGNTELDAYEKVIPLRQEISRLVREHVRKALDSSPRQQAWDALLEDRRQLMRAINDTNDEINGIGKNYIPYTVRFRGDSQ